MSRINIIKLCTQCATMSVTALRQLCYCSLYPLVKAVSYIPFRVLYLLSDLLYYPVYYVVRYRRKIVRKNLIESFPDKGRNEIIRIEKSFYRFFVDMALESCKMISISPDEMRQRMKFVNIELANQPLFRTFRQLGMGILHETMALRRSSGSANLSPITQSIHGQTHESRTRTLWTSFC